jgi:hypothetical protein
MSIPRRSAHWKPRDLREALRAVKDHGRERHQLSAERLADLLDVTVDTLYKSKLLPDSRSPRPAPYQVEVHEN